MTEIMEELRLNQKKIAVAVLRGSKDFYLTFRIDESSARNYYYRLRTPMEGANDNYGEASLNAEEFIDLAEQLLAEYYKIKRKNKYIDMPVCFLPGKRIFIVMSLYQELAWGDSGHPTPSEKEALNRLVVAKGTKEDLLLIRSMLENRKKWGLVSMVDNFLSQENIE